VKPGIWYVNLDHLALEFWTENLPNLANASAVIFDMRGYPTIAVQDVLGHLTDKPIHSGQFNVPTYTRPDREDASYDPPNWWTIAPAAPRLKGKIIFLTGPHAVSWAESVMGTVAYNHLATIVGATTAGTNGDVDPSHLPGGYFFQFTGLRVLAEDGSRFFGIGIKPDVPVEPTIAGIRAGRDEVLDKAVAIASQAQ
jgi:C-terminal processing protease CtpA/Prc